MQIPLANQPEALEALFILLPDTPPDIHHNTPRERCFAAIVENISAFPGILDIRQRKAEYVKIFEVHWDKLVDWLMYLFLARTEGPDALSDPQKRKDGIKGIVGSLAVCFMVMEDAVFNGVPQANLTFIELVTRVWMLVDTRYFDENEDIMVVSPLITIFAVGHRATLTSIFDTIVQFSGGIQNLVSKLQSLLSLALRSGSMDELQICNSIDLVMLIVHHLGGGKCGKLTESGAIIRCIKAMNRLLKIKLQQKPPAFAGFLKSKFAYTLVRVFQMTYELIHSPGSRSSAALILRSGYLEMTIQSAPVHHLLPHKCMEDEIQDFFNEYLPTQLVLRSVVKAATRIFFDISPNNIHKSVRRGTPEFKASWYRLEQMLMERTAYRILHERASGRYGDHAGDSAYCATVCLVLYSLAMAHMLTDFSALNSVWKLKRKQTANSLCAVVARA